MGEQRKRKSRENDRRTKSSKHPRKRREIDNKKIHKSKNTRPASKQRKTNKPHKKRKVIPKKKNPIVTLLFNFFFYSFISFMVMGSILFATSKSSDRSILGYRFFEVLTDSMVPRDPQTQKGGFHSGDIIVVRDIKGDSAEVGDIITFRPSIKSSAFLTHRVKKKMDHLGDTNGTYYITQGDANNAEDVPVSEKQVVGKTFFVIPKVGGILNFISENVLVSVVFLISVFGFITVVRYYILNK